MSRQASTSTAAWLLLATLILVFAPVSFAFNGVLSNARPSTKNDFTSYYVAGLALRKASPAALYYPEPVGSLLAQASNEHPWIDLARSAGIENPNYYLYPPLFAVLFAPLTLLPYEAAYLVWVALGAALLFASVWMLIRQDDAARQDRLRSPGFLLPAAALVLMACSFYPVSRTVAVGQSSLLMLALMTGAFVALSRDGTASPEGSRCRDILGATALACGILLKLTPALLLPWLVFRRRWRALAWCGVALAVLLGISVATAGLESHQVYFGRMISKLSGGTAFYPNQSISGMLARAAGGEMRLADLVDPASPQVLIARLAALVLMVGGLLLIWRRRLDDTHAFSLLVLITLAISPISWEHHYVLALIPAWVLLKDADGGALGPVRAVASGAALAAVGSSIGPRVIEAAGALGLRQPAASACLLGGLALCCLIAWAPARAVTGEARQAAPGALLLMMAVFASAGFLFKLAEYNRAYRYGDFTSYYVAAATLREGSGALYHPATPDMILARAETPGPWTETAARWGVRDANYYLYPPFFAMAMMPLTMLPYEAAHLLWYLANLAALGACVWLFVMSDADWPRPRLGVNLMDLTLALVAIALSWPSLFTFGAGQANFVVLLLLLGALTALRAKRDVAGGLMVAGAAAIKMTPALLLVYLAWRRRWVALGAAAAGLCALVVAGAAAAGWSSYEVYATQMVPLLSRGCAHWINESFAGFFTRLIDGADIFSWAIASLSPAARGMTMAAGLLVAGASLAMAGRREASLDLEFCLLVVATLFISPLSWTHHSVLSLMAFLMLARHLTRDGILTAGWVLAMTLSFTLVHVHLKPPGILSGGPLAILASYNLAGNLMLWGLLAVALRRKRVGDAAAA